MLDVAQLQQKVAFEKSRKRDQAAESSRAYRKAFTPALAEFQEQSDAGYDSCGSLSSTEELALDFEDIDHAELKKANHYKWFVGSNEKSIPDLNLFKDSHFVVLGCSCIKSIETVFKSIDWDNYDPKGSVPQLMVLELSEHVIKAWSNLKIVTEKASSLDEFHKRILGYELFSDVRIQSFPKNSAEKFLYQLKQFCFNDKQYQFLKQVVNKTIVCFGDWADNAVIQQMRRQINGRSLVVYASNIPEYALCFFGPVVLSDIVDNIIALDPLQTIYASSQESVRRQTRLFMPHRMSVVQGSSKPEHLEDLKAGDSVVDGYLKSIKETKLRL